MLGKTSVGVRCKTIGDIRTMTNAATIKVYGRVSAIRTIHMHQASMFLGILLRATSPAELKQAVFPGSVLIGCPIVPTRYIGSPICGRKRPKAVPKMNLLTRLGLE